LFCGRMCFVTAIPSKSPIWMAHTDTPRRPCTSSDVCAPARSITSVYSHLAAGPTPAPVSSVTSPCLAAGGVTYALPACFSAALPSAALPVIFCFWFGFLSLSGFPYIWSRRSRHRYAAVVHRLLRRDRLHHRVLCHAPSPAPPRAGRSLFKGITLCCPSPLPPFASLKRAPGPPGLGTRVYPRKAPRMPSVVLLPDDVACAAAPTARSVAINPVVVLANPPFPALPQRTSACPSVVPL